MKRGGPLLYISPIMPALTGNGLAMRAAIMLEALAADHDVHLLVIPVAGGARVPCRSVSRWCARIAVQPLVADPLFGLVSSMADAGEQLAAYASYPRPALCRFATTSAVRNAQAAFAGTDFREVHVFRLYMAPFADPHLQGRPGARPTCRLDFDDCESQTRSRLAALYARAGIGRAAVRERLEARKYAALERRYLPLFDRVYLCSETDRAAISRYHPRARFAVIPNAVRRPRRLIALGHATGPFTFLFVGNLSYYPNQDAALFFGAEVFPRIRAATSQAVRALIVGPHPATELLQLMTQADISVTGAVPDIAAAYRQADAVVVPVRAGGGSRIKLLEAWSFGRPVVSTPVGAEGVAARDEAELLIADGPSDFAAQCVRLMARPALRAALSRRALAFVTKHHGPARILALLRADRAGTGSAHRSPR